MLSKTDVVRLNMNLSRLMFSCEVGQKESGQEQEQV